MTDTEREYLQEQVGEEAYFDDMKAARKLLERWGALIYVDALSYQWQARLMTRFRTLDWACPSLNYHRI
jgi:hypothetical protein